MRRYRNTYWMLVILAAVLFAVPMVILVRGWPLMTIVERIIAVAATLVMGIYIRLQCIMLGETLRKDHEDG